MYADTAKRLWNGNGTRVLCVEGYIRSNGNTAGLLSSFLEGMPRDSEVVRFNPYKQGVLTCTGCNYCENAGRCVNNDLDTFFSLMETADILIFASPVYNLSFPAPTKALIDRLQVYYTGHFSGDVSRRIAKRRKGYLLVTAGHEGKEGFEVMERQLKNAFSILNTEYAGGKLVGNTDFE